MGAMDVVKYQSDGSTLEHAPQDDRLLLKWLEKQRLQSQKFLAEQKLNEFFIQAAQPRHASGNACIRLCYFIEQCKSSSLASLRGLAFSESTCLSLFTFYIEWNEKNQNRSMRQILELISSLIAQNPDKEISKCVKISILQKTLSIIRHEAAQPLVKPAFKSLECFLSKHAISTAELISVSMNQDSLLDITSKHINHACDALIAEAFDWMALPDVSPAAGKFLVTVFRELREDNALKTTSHSSSWQRWIRKGLSKDPEALENVKIYLFPPLFKLDRPGSIAFLEELNSKQQISSLQDQEFDAQALLQLSALDIGKKAGLVEESSVLQFQKSSKKKATHIILQEATILPLFVHTSEMVRSLAFSVLVSSSSTIRPFTPMSLDILQSSIGVLYSDTDAKFRNEVLSNTKHMIERLRGATAFLKREVDSITFSQERQGKDYVEQSDTVNLMTLHEGFLKWYLHFLLAELIPTSSYQRHITALKAIQLLLSSGILEHDPSLPPLRFANNETSWPFSIKFFNRNSLRLLLDLIMDPFEDVRAAATSILKFASPNALSNINSSSEPFYSESVMIGKTMSGNVHIPDSKGYARTDAVPNNESMDILNTFLTRATAASKLTGRADYADGVARCYELLYGLDSSSDSQISLFEKLVDDLTLKVELAEKDLGKAVLEAPIHGAFAALNFVWGSMNHTRVESSSCSKSEFTPATNQNWKELQTTIYNCCSRIWKAVFHVLCNDSPEGHMPEDIDDDNPIDTKDVLSYSFRALHESSNLMRTMASKVKLTWQDESFVVPFELFKAIGDLSFEQLSNLRHRGAFSTVSLTFARVCQLSQSGVSGQFPEVKTLLDEYYQGALKCISEQASTTRRSAGIPALITGILSSNARSPAFIDVMTELKSLAQQPVHVNEVEETALPQVHAMNCLKEIFKSSALGKKSDQHLTDCLQIAADSLNSDTWAIRNCGLLLLRSLIDCLFGTSESKLVTEAGWDGRSIRLSYDKYPALPQMLLKLLTTATSISEPLVQSSVSAVESVFPALDIIRRAGPPDVDREDISRHVTQQLSSKVWHVREIAARTVCTLLLHDNWLAAVEGLVGSCIESVNRTHGVLLALKFFLERKLSLNAASAIDYLPSLVRIVINSDAFRKLEHDRNPSPALTAYIEFFNTVATLLLAVKEDQRQDIRDIIDQLFPTDAYGELRSRLALNSTDALFQISLVRRAILTTALRKDSFSLHRVIQYISKTDIDVILAALECMPQAWGSKKAVLKISEGYISILENSLSPEIRTLAVDNLANILDQNLSDSLLNDIDVFSILQKVKYVFSGAKRSPGLENSQIRISGWAMLSDVVSSTRNTEQLPRDQMIAWGEMLTLAGNANQDFDMRYAAAAALHSFFGAIPSKLLLAESDDILSPLLALYDTLNDDDEDIREIGARTVSSILNRSLVPLAASKTFIGWLLKTFSTSDCFASKVVGRMTGSHPEAGDGNCKLQAVHSQLIDSMKEDNALFVEEEQNLFIDAVRETKIWASAFQGLTSNALSTTSLEFNTNEIALQLAVWTFEGLVSMSNITDTDGVLGWTSKPRAFAVCTRVLMCTDAILEYNDKLVKSPHYTKLPNDHISLWQTQIKLILEALERFIIQGRRLDIHQSLMSEISTLSSHKLTNLSSQSSKLVPQLSDS